MEESPVAAKAAAAENRIVGVRLAVIAFNVGIYWTLLDRTGHRLGLAVAVSVVAGVYALAAFTLQPVRRSAVLGRSSFTVATDSALIALWLLATGASASLFYPLWAVSLVAIAFRFGPRVTAFSTGLYVFLDAVVVLSDGFAAAWPEELVRVAYIVFVGLLGILVARETGDQFRRRIAVEQERRRWRAQEDRLRGLAEATMEGIVLHEDGRIIEANAAYARLAGVPAEDLTGRMEPLLAGSTGPGPTELEHEGADGVVRILRIQQRPYRYRDREVMVAAVRDVTAERHAETVRDQARRQEQEIERLQEMDRFKSDFINAAAHELNTPLTPLKLQLHMLKNGTAATIPRSVDILERNLERLGGLVGDMLDVARLQSGRLRIEPEQLDLGRIVWDVVDTYQEDAEQRGVELQADVPLDTPVFADADRMAQVLHNLVSNALKFTPDGGSVVLEAEAGGGAVHLGVRDTGIGLTDEQMRSLFQPFSHVHRDQAHTGTGLGLYISKNLVESMDGRMWCASDGAGQGATFHVMLPTHGPGAGGRDAQRPSPDDAVPAP